MSSALLIREATLNPLQTLIADRRSELRLSYQDIAKRGGLPKSTVHKLATADTWATIPHPETLDRLAVGLSLPPSLVRAAASETAGLTRSVHTEQTDNGMNVLMGSIATLTPEQRKQVAALVNAMLAEK